MPSEGIRRVAEFHFAAIPIYWKRLCYLVSGYLVLVGFLALIYFARTHETRKESAIRNPPEVDAIVTKSNVAKDAKQFDDAIKTLEEGLVKYPNSDRLLAHRGGVDYDRKRWNEALPFYLKAFNLTNSTDTTYASVISVCYNKMGQMKQAVHYAKLMYDLKPSMQVLTTLHDMRTRLHDWTDWIETRDTIMQTVSINRGGRSNLDPYSALHYPFTIDELSKIATSFGQSMTSNAKSKCPTFFHQPRTNPEQRRIKIGYVSYDFRRHAVGVQIKSMFGYHNRSRYEIYCYSVNDGSTDSFEDETYNQIKQHCEHMVMIGREPIENATRRIYNDSVDILVDLGLYTAYSRLELLSCRPAPVTAAWLGLAITTGMPWVDYYVGDRVGVPERFRRYYSEKIIYLPHSYHIFDHKQSYPGGVFGDKTKYLNIYPIKEDAFYFCNFQNNQRIDPEIFAVWARIVKRVNNSALILKHFNDDASDSLRARAVEHGLRVTSDGNSQFILIPGIGGHEHVIMKGICDLELDVRKYNGHSTSGDMLWAGVPILTYPGEMIAARAAASFVTTSGFPDWVVFSWKEYEDLAIRFALNRTLLAEMRQQLRDNQPNNPLFDTARFVRNLERGFEAAFWRWQNGLKPDHIIVKEDS